MKFTLSRDKSQVDETREGKSEAELTLLEAGLEPARDYSQGILSLS